ncbi:helix-turn-helix domain-containing protein [uncultured Sneathia sp.]
MEVLERICKHLNCATDDIIEINFKDGEKYE